MATSTGKTLALIFLVALILLIGLRLTPWVMAPFGVVTGMVKSIRVPVDHSDFIPFSIRWTTLSLFSLALLVFWIAIIVWVYRDAERRGMNGILWALLVLIGNLIGLIIYLIVRTDMAKASLSAPAPPTTKPCPGCQRPVAVDFTYCPHCGARLAFACGKCGKPVESAWKVCPHCGAELKNG